MKKAIALTAAGIAAAITISAAPANADPFGGTSPVPMSQTRTLDIGVVHLTEVRHRKVLHLTSGLTSFTKWGRWHVSGVDIGQS